MMIYLCNRHTHVNCRYRNNEKIRKLAGLGIAYLGSIGLRISILEKWTVTPDTCHEEKWWK